MRHSLDRWFTPLAVLPTFVVMVLVFGLPLLFLPYLSFTGGSPSQDLLGGEFVGWANYQDLLEDPVLLGSLGITFGFAAGALAAQLALGLAIALLLNMDLPHMRAFRTALIMPMMIDQPPASGPGAADHPRPAGAKNGGYAGPEQR